MKALLDNKIVRIPASSSPYSPVYDTEFLESQNGIPGPPSRIHNTPLPSWKTIEKADNDPSSSTAKVIKSPTTPTKCHNDQVSTPGTNFTTDRDVEGRIIYRRRKDNN